MRFRLAAWVIRNRVWAALAFLLVTIFFALGLPRVEFRTIFSDLLPADDPFVQVFKDHPNFGNPLTMTIMIKRADGKTIYNKETLKKVWDLTRDIDLTPGVDHDQVLSIAATGARYAEATPYGIEMQPLMGDRPPQTDVELQEFRERVRKAAGARTFLISQDETAALVQATFIERILDYGVAFEFVQKLVKQARDEEHEVYMAGQPALTGWVYEYQGQMVAIFAVTLGMLVLALVFYLRNVVGLVTPIVTSAIAAVWGFGLVGWIASPVEPLLLVVPLLLIARSFSHSVQFTERYYEIYAQIGDRSRAAEATMGVMLPPSVLGILTDSIGIFLIAIAPIPAMERFALFAGFWSLCMIPTGVFLISLLLTVLPSPRNAKQITGSQKQLLAHALIRRILQFIAGFVSGKRARVTAAIVVVGAVYFVHTAAQIKIGNPVEGSNLLWPDSEYNESVSNINAHFPGVNTLEIVLESKTPDDLTNRVGVKAKTVQAAAELQYLMEGSDAPPKNTLTFSNYIMEGNRLYQGGNPKWLPIDPIDRHTSGAANAIMQGGDPKYYSHVIDIGLQSSTVSLWYADNKQGTVDAALAAARKAVASVGEEHEDFRVLLGTGSIALQQATNLVVERYHYLILGCLNLAIFIMCTIAYRSIIAGIFLLIPVNLANSVLTATMHLIGIGLDINSVMVAVIGVGVGIDYGIYLLSRICEEYKRKLDWQQALEQSLVTTGRAILFTATIMLVGMLPWYFLSGLKFTADMGLLLVCIMLINMALALIVLPLLVWFIKPRFVSRTDLLVGEALDLSAWEQATVFPGKPAMAT